MHAVAVGGFISPGDEVNHSCIIRKLHKDVGVVSRSAVVGQQGEDERARHTSLGSPSVHHDGAGCVPALSEVSQ